MTWPVVARKEFEDAVRARVLWGIVAVIGVLAGGLAVVVRFLPGVGSNPLTALGAASEFAAILVPILSLVAAYLAVAGERESGSVKVLLGLPPSRGEVLLGKFVGRSGVVAVGLTLGLAVAGAGTAVAHGGLPLAKFAWFTALTVALGIAFVGIAVGISAATATRSRAMSLSIAVYLVFVLLWDLHPQGFHLLLNGAPPGAVVPAWFLALESLSPPGAYSAVVGVVLTAGTGAPGMGARLAGPVPVYLEPWFLLGVLALWAAVPLALGYRAFDRADL